MKKFTVLLLISNIINSSCMHSAQSGTNSGSQANPQRNITSFDLRNQAAVKHLPSRAFASCPVKTIKEAGN